MPFVAQAIRMCNSIHANVTLIASPLIQLLSAQAIRMCNSIHASG
jgi:hypothetical protein